MLLRLRPAAEADLDAIADIAAAAFHPDTDAISQRLFPPHLHPVNTADNEPARSWRLARKGSKLQAKHTAMMVAIDDALDGQVVGFALWDVPMPNEKPGNGVAPQVRHEALDEVAFAEMHQVLEEDVHKHFGEGGIKDMWHLDYIGVDPQQQRKGIGKMLLDWGVKEAVRDRKHIYLVATPAGRPLYRAAGFEELATLQIFGVQHYSMIRKYSPK